MHAEGPASPGGEQGGALSADATRTSFQTRSAWVLLALAAVLDLIMLAGDVGQGEPEAVRGELLVLVLLPLLAVLTRKGHPTAVIHSLLAMLWLASSGIGFGGAGLYGNSALFLMPLPLVGALFTSWRGAAAWLSIAVGTALLYLYGHAHGWMGDPTAALPGPADRAKDFLITMAMCGGVGLAFLKLQHDDLRRVQASLAELRAENQRRREAEERAQAATRTKSRFLATMSHELRTPLNGVICAARLLDAESDPRAASQLRHTLIDSAEGLLALINDILDFSKLEEDDVLEAVPTDLARLMESTVASLLPVAAAAEVALVAEIDDSARDPVVCDPTRMRQIVTNLVGNALKFTRQGGVTVRLLRSTRGHELSVEDTGIGIDEGALDRLFTPFTQGDSSIARRFGGTGLGLAIVDRLVARMGGHVEVESAPGVGTLFRVVLPLEAAERSDLQESSSLPLADLPDAPLSLRVLVVDDNAVNRQLQTLLLQQWGHHCESVDGGGEAVERLATESWDLVLMDCQMPGVDGLMATRLTRALPAPHSRVWIAGLSADPRSEARSAAMDAGMDDYLTKPLRSEAFDRTVARLSRRQAHPQTA